MKSNKLVDSFKDKMDAFLLGDTTDKAEDRKRVVKSWELEIFLLNGLFGSQVIVIANLHDTLESHGL